MGLAYSYRCSVHYHHGGKHGSTQTDMVMEKEPRALHLDLKSAGRLLCLILGRDWAYIPSKPHPHRDTPPNSVTSPGHEYSNLHSAQWIHYPHFLQNPVVTLSTSPQCPVVIHTSFVPSGFTIHTFTSAHWLHYSPVFFFSSQPGQWSVLQILGMFENLIDDTWILCFSF